MLDLVVRNGSVVDGTGGPSRQVDVGLEGGRIVVVGAIDEPAASTIDAAGLAVCPGFVDLHTHYDPRRRLYSEPTGVVCTIVNGVVTSRDGKLTGDTPGAVLRSGLDTDTVNTR